MRVYLLLVLAVGKLARRVVRVRGHGGSALPGVVTERMLPSFNRQMLNQLPDGVVVVSGTNGKTSTTKMIVEVLRAAGKCVLTNDTGSNFTRGIAAAIVATAKVRGQLPYDIAVFELDEAYGALFAAQCRPAYVVALNVMRDQLDRFGEIDLTAQLLGELLQSARTACIVNGDDPGLVAISSRLNTPVHYFGVAANLQPQFPADDELLAQRKRERPRPTFAVELASFRGQNVSFRLASKTYTQTLAIKGRYNFQNAAACLALAQLLLPNASPKTLLSYLAHSQPAFGRGETLQVAGQPLEIILVKNPAGFRQALLSFDSPASCMIAINNHHADGRDVSWLWDVDFSSLRSSGVRVVAGMRARNMARRLWYDDVPLQTVDADIHRALEYFVRHNPDQPGRIFCTYTAMLAIRSQLTKYTEVAKVL